MDAFFASIEQLDNPSLSGKPVVVGYDGPRGVVAAASYEARKFGCHSAQPMVQAKRLCSSLLIVPVRMDRYREMSRAVFEIFDAFSPVVEPLSVDEAFLDLSGTERLLGAADDVALRMKVRIKSEVGLTASVGVAPNKFLAKLASDLEKPDGLTVIRPGDIDRILPSLSVSKLWGIGKVTEAKLAAAGIKTIGQFRQATSEKLERLLGNEAQRYMRLAYGLDTRVVTPDRQAKSIGHEQTFSVNVENPQEISRVLMDQVELVGQRLRRSAIEARGLSLKIRFGDFQTISRSTTLAAPTNSTQDLWQAAQKIFSAWPFQPVRLIGVSAEKLSAAQEQLGLFTDPVRDRQKKLDAVADRINTKFGKRTIRRGQSQ